MSLTFNPFHPDTPMALNKFDESFHWTISNLQNKISLRMYWFNVQPSYDKRKDS